MNIVGHRGAEKYAPENTITSFEKAIVFGCQRVECDVRFSRDGELVIMHDADIERTTNGKGLVAEMSLQELKAVECLGGERIPTLQEVIDICKERVDIQIELKAEGLERDIVEILAKNDFIEHAYISSFEGAYLLKIKQIRKDIKTIFLFREMPENLWQMAKEMCLDYVGPKATIVSREFVEKAHSEGLKVYAYGVKDEEVGTNMKLYEVDDIGTALLEHFCEKKGEK